MAHCSGCGCTLSWKKYKFQRMWHIPGYYCKPCMLDLGKEFDKYGRLDSVTSPCAMCGVEYYFLKSAWSGGKQNKYCAVCHEAVKNGVVPPPPKDGAKRRLPAQPKQLPLTMIIFAGLGGLMMVMGLIFTMMSTGEDANILNILFGAATTAMGFVLVRRTLKSRSLLLGAGRRPPDAGK